MRNNYSCLLIIKAVLEPAIQYDFWIVQFVRNGIGGKLQPKIGFFGIVVFHALDLVILWIVLNVQGLN